MPELVDLRPDHLSAIRAILNTHAPDCEVWVFGSRAKWTAKDTSDLDLTIVADKPIPRTTLDRLRRAFEESYLPFKVDVVDIGRISDEFREVIRGQKVVLQQAILPRKDASPTRPDCF